MRPLNACSALLLAAFIFAGATGCERITPVRTLPAWVRGVYVPMIKNKSYEPGLEETATRLVQEQFLFDGRLDVVPKHQADMIVVAEIVDWRGREAGSSGDRVSNDEEVTLTASVSLFEPYNMETPVATLPPITIVRSFNIDTRSVDYEPEPDRKREVLENLARAIVDNTITGFPVQLGAVNTGPALPAFAPASDSTLDHSTDDTPENSSVGPQ